MKLSYLVPFLFLGLVSANANERNFAFTYETATLPKGGIELENHVTWKHRNGVNGFDFRHEIEYGVTDRLQLSLYLADWTVRDGEGDHKRARYKDTAVEAIYSLTNPVTDFIGSAIYGEVKVGDRLFEAEGKLILQKNIGRWIIAYNGALEAELEGAHLNERTGEFTQTLGISYQVSPRLGVGMEALHEVEWPSWGKPEPSRVYVGPNVTARAGEFFATLTPLVQVTSEKEEPKLQTRLVFGWHF